MISSQSINKLKEKVQISIAEKNILKKNIEKLEKEISSLNSKVIAIEKLRVIIQVASQKIQSQIEYHLSSMVTMALSSVYSEDIEFIVKFEPRRNTIELDFLFKVDNGEEQEIIGNFGGGILDITAFALRIIMLSIKQNVRKILILDEPFKHVSPDLQHKVSEMIKMINEKTKIQIIMNSHADDINDCADKTFIVEKEDNKSIVKEII